MTVNDDLGRLLELLACPVCRGELSSAPGELVCLDCARAFELSDGVPIFLDPGVAQKAPSFLTRVLETALRNHRLYDFQQRHGGGREIGERVKKHLSDARGVVLDVGAGTGMAGGLVPATTRYVWLDNDVLRLRGLRARALACEAVLGDAARLPFRNDAVDWTVVIEVSHHLPDAWLHSSLDESARVTRHRLLFVDALRATRYRSRFLWRLDLGGFPRTEDQLLEALERSFDVISVERFRINHDHLLCVCAPRRGPLPAEPPATSE